MKAYLRANPLQGVLLIMLAFLAFLMIASSLISRGSCAWYGYQTDRTTRYAIGVGCMVKMPTGWTPQRELRTEQ